MKKFSFFIALILALFICTKTPAQNVGIGTASPSNKLTVAGKANIINSCERIF